MNRTTIINSLIKKINAKKYLEIGISAGENFGQIECEYKIGVDSEPLSPATLHLTSDDFFIFNREKFDVIFIDGLHISEQVLKDIENSLLILNEGGYIIAHDLHPWSEEVQIVPYQGGAWTGDCWKAFVKLRQTRDDLEMFVVDVDCGCGVITKGKQELVNIGEELNYHNFEKNKKEWLNLISYKEFEDRIYGKFKNFPPIYWLTLERSKDRQENMNRQMDYYGLTNRTMVYGYDGKVEDYTNHPIVSGAYFSQMNSCDVACAISHVKAIKQWYQNSDSEYAIIFEDDVDLSISDFWNFTWEDIMKILPTNWNVIQLCLIRVEDIDTVRLHMRTNINWSGAAYLINRDYARRIVEDYCPEETYTLFLKGDPKAIPFIENVVYFLGEPFTFTLPLFIENISFNSAFYPEFIQDPRKDSNIKSSQFVYNWWRENGKNITVEDLL